MDQVLSLDMREYRLLCEAHRLRQVDQKLWIHMQAYTTQLAGSHDKRGKPIYPRFKDFFDYDKELKGGSGKEKTIDPRLEAMKRHLKKKREEGEHG